MGFNLFGKQDKTLTELQDENERKDLELSITQKEAMMAKLREEHLSLQKDFGGSIARCWKWFKTH